jgi:hypothetical protein
MSIKCRSGPLNSLKDVRLDEHNKTCTGSSNRMQLNFALMVNASTEPSTFKEVVEHEERQKDIIDEYESVIENNTQKLVDCPPNVKPIGCKWIYKIKYNRWYD